ncbi:MAG TPA: phosphoglycerate kinase [Candidatus Omnitrophota bacterium]|nr:phosphoglycerate kinase [Candidatus Omnitrophota bacterium]HRZ15683.1 phosphoglycerate kinase [Candidatus Omnitrophota bacterium]
MAKMTVRDLDLKGKTVLMRADFNVPLDANLAITDDTRIRETVPTIKFILEKGAKKLVLMSHLGRPDGKRVDKYSLKPVAQRLEELAGTKVAFLNDCIGEEVKKGVAAASEKIVLLENLRYYAQEEGNDPEFARQLAGLAEVFVNDAFGTAHRAHASTAGVNKYLKSAAGLLLEKEIKYLGDAVADPAKPFMVILGGSKVSDKIGVIDNLLPKCDAIIVGGGMAYTFLKAQGKSIGNSKLEKDKIDLAKSILDKAAAQKKEIVLPVDHVIVDTVDANARTEICGQDIPDGKIAVDIGPKTVELFNQKLSAARTIVWNGPVGIFEMDAFSKGTKALGEFIGSLKAVTIIGGGDTAAAVAKFKLQGKMTHISTGGGASLEFLEGKTLPGIAALSDK